jgi:transcriptional regulator
MFDGSQDLPKGTLDLMILTVLSVEPMHGWGIIQRIRHLSREVFQVNQGSLYPGLQRLKKRGWIRSQWQVTENRRRARYYTLTDLGEKQLGREKAAWEVSTSAVRRILEATS